MTPEDHLLSLQQAQNARAAAQQQQQPPAPPQPNYYQPASPVGEILLPPVAPPAPPQSSYVPLAAVPAQPAPVPLVDPFAEVQNFGIEIETPEYILQPMAVEEETIPAGYSGGVTVEESEPTGDGNPEQIKVTYKDGSELLIDIDESDGQPILPDNFVRIGDKFVNLDLVATLTPIDIV